jgi:DNA topoisomerase-2
MEKQREQMWILDKKSEKIIQKEIVYIPGFLKIFDEILVNAIDQSTVDSSVSFIKVDIDSKSISVSNDGKTIPIVFNEKENMYVPELIFGNLLTGSNFNDKKIVGGKNGLGSKLTNIFSTKFEVEIVNNGTMYKQTFEDNMKLKTLPQIKETKKSNYIKMHFYPDFKRFGMDKIDDDTEGLLKRRVLDTIANVNKKVNVFLNGSKVSGKGLIDYINYYDIPNKDMLVSDKFEKKEGKNTFVWEYAILPSQNGFQQISFVNGINTLLGGNHVTFFMKSFSDNMIKILKSSKEFKNLDIKPNDIKENVFLFLRSTIVDPGFNSQSKEALTSKDFGVDFKISDKFFNTLQIKIRKNLKRT